MRRRLLAGATLTALLGPVAFAQTGPWPNAPITLVVPFAAGSGTDAVARIVAERLAARLKQPVIVDNKPGASAQIAAQIAARAKPDGYTLFMTTNTSHSANPSLFKELKYDPIKDFTPIIRLGELPFALAVHPSVPAKTVKEFIDYAKANPGRVSYGTPNSTSLVSSETMRVVAGIDIVGVPYKSSPQAMNDLMGGQIQMYVVDFGSGIGTLKTDKIRALGVTSAAGSKIMPDLPPIARTLPGFDFTSWNGMFGPAGLPRPIVDRINNEVQAILADREIQEKLALTGFEVRPSTSPEDFAHYVADQLAYWTKMIKQAGIKPE